MFARFLSSLAAASLTLAALACAQTALAQTSSHPSHAAYSHDAHLAAGGGFGSSLHTRPSSGRGASAGYGLRANGSSASEPLGGGSALMAESMRTGSLRADIARYNAERAGHAVGGPDGARPSAEAANVF